METNTQNKKNKWYSERFRWLYVAIAIVASALLLCRPVFTFQQDKGIIYTRHFEMDQKMLTVIQTGLEDHIDYVENTRSVVGLFVCQQLMLWNCVLCLLCLLNNYWVKKVAFLPILSAGAYYAFVVYYAVDITDRFFATLSPTWIIVLPAIVLEMMVLIRKGVDRLEEEQTEGVSE